LESGVIQRARTLATAGLLTVLATAVWWLGPDPRSLAPAVRHPQSYVDRVGADQAALVGICVLCWALLAWLAVGLSFAAAAALPGVAGQACEAVADRLLPGTLRRTAAVALGLSVATAGGGAALALWHPTDRAGSSSTVAVDWPDSGTHLDPDWPSGGTPDRQQITTTRSRHAAPRSTAVLVAPGDSLWRIAARRLGPGADDAAIAREWPRWYAANRAVIGADPNLIHPGQRLVPPA
jgi:nucleoid-associated protein YgaU